MSHLFIIIYNNNTHLCCLRTMLTMMMVNGECLWWACNLTIHCVIVECVLSACNSLINKCTRRQTYSRHIIIAVRFDNAKNVQFKVIISFSPRFIHIRDFPPVFSALTKTNHIYVWCVVCARSFNRLINVNLIEKRENKIAHELNWNNCSRCTLHRQTNCSSIFKKNMLNLFVLNTIFLFAHSSCIALNGMHKNEKGKSWTTKTMYCKRSHSNSCCWTAAYTYARRTHRNRRTTIRQEQRSEILFSFRILYANACTRTNGPNAWPMFGCYSN